MSTLNRSKDHCGSPGCAGAIIIPLPFWKRFVRLVEADGKKTAREQGTAWVADKQLLK